MTAKQVELLSRLPDAPSDGLLCKGPRFRIAETLARKGYARRIAAAMWGEGGYYVRTPEGVACARLAALGEE